METKKFTLVNHKKDRMTYFLYLFQFLSIWDKLDRKIPYSAKFPKFELFYFLYCILQNAHFNEFLMSHRKNKYPFCFLLRANRLHKCICKVYIFHLILMWFFFLWIDCTETLQCTHMLIDFLDLLWFSR